MMSFLPLYTTVTILDVCKGEGVFYLMFEVTVSMLPFYTKPLRAYIVELLNAHVVCNLVDLSWVPTQWGLLRSRFAGMCRLTWYRANLPDL